MSKKRRVYSPEFKREAVQLAERSDKSVGQIEEELGITPGLRRKWKGQQQRAGAEAFRGHGQRTAAEEEVYQLRRENERLRQAREILRPGRAAPKKQWPSSRGANDEISVHRRSSD